MSMKEFILELMFKNKLYSSHGMIFQDLFNKLLRTLDPSAHIIAQYGGDGGCDGYSLSLGIHFALTTQKDSLSNKIKEDFGKYLTAPKSQTFVFVYPRNDIRREMSDTIEMLKANHSSITIELYDFDKLIELFNSLSDTEKIKVLEVPPISDNSIGDENSIVVIILKIIEKCNSTSVLELDSFTENKLPEFSHKLAYNGSAKLKNYLENASNFTAAKRFFDNNPEMLEQLRRFVNQQYHKVKKIPDIDADTIVFMVMCECYSNITEGNFTPILSIMAHIIELCDLLAEPILDREE